MEFEDQVIAVYGVDNPLGWTITEELMARGARHVLAITHGANDQAPVCLPHGAKGQFVRIADGTLDTPEKLDALTSAHGRIDAVINLVPLAGPSIRGGGNHPGEIAARTTGRLVAALRDHLRLTDDSHAALVNVGWATPDVEGFDTIECAAATGSLEVLTEALAKQLAPCVRVNAVLSTALPTAVVTPRGVGEAADTVKRLKEAAGPALFLASKAARHMTGSVLLADAGRSLGFSAFSAGSEA